MKLRCPSWLSGAVFYQVYPQSFYDSNNDGTGDLKGIIEKLDYIQSLGCNAIWINPCFVSPFDDAGYDVADYYKIAPRYGTNSDMKRLFKEAAKKQIRVCLDLVPGHTSMEHPWFKESCKPERNEYMNRYIWTDNVWDAGCEEMSFIKGAATRDGNYASNFFSFQPALNYGFAKPDPSKPWQLPVDHPDVKAVLEEMKSVMRYWLEMGAGGFRVDMASSLVKNDPDCTATKKLWKDVRAMFDTEYPDAALLAEWSFGPAAIAAGFHADFMLDWGTPAYTSLFRLEKGSNISNHTIGNSFFAKEGKGNISIFMDVFLEHCRKIKNKGHLAIPTGNHDLPRISYGRTRKEIELVFAFVLTMPAIPFIYYGDEIGMKYQKGLVSKEGGYNRTGSRTPMQWNSEKNAGFSTADKKKLYLPVDESSTRPTVAAQQGRRNSLLSKVRSLVHLRRDIPALQADGGFSPLYANDKKYPLIYLRTMGREKVVIMVNPSKKPVSVRFESPEINSIGELILGHGVEFAMNKSFFHVKMKGVSYGIYKC
jgi:glycosidase